MIWSKIKVYGHPTQEYLRHWFLSGAYGPIYIVCKKQIRFLIIAATNDVLF